MSPPLVRYLKSEVTAAYPPSTWRKVLRIEGLPGQVQVRGFDGDARPVWMEERAPHPVADGERRVPFVLASLSDDDAAVVAVVVARRRGFHAV